MGSTPIAWFLRSAQTAASAAACLHGVESDTNQVAALAEAAQQAVVMPRKMGMSVIAQDFPSYEGPLISRNSSQYGAGACGTHDQS